MAAPAGATVLGFTGSMPGRPDSLTGGGDGLPALSEDCDDEPPPLLEYPPVPSSITTAMSEFRLVGLDYRSPLGGLARRPAVMEAYLDVLVSTAGDDVAYEGGGHRTWWFAAPVAVRDLLHCCARDRGHVGFPEEVDVLLSGFTAPSMPRDSAWPDLGFFRACGDDLHRAATRLRCQVLPGLARAEYLRSHFSTERYAVLDHWARDAGFVSFAGRTDALRLDLDAAGAPLGGYTRPVPPGAVDILDLRASARDRTLARQRGEVAPQPARAAATRHPLIHLDDLHPSVAGTTLARWAGRRHSLLFTDASGSSVSVRIAAPAAPPAVAPAVDLIVPPAVAPAVGLIVLPAPHRGRGLRPGHIWWTLIQRGLPLPDAPAAPRPAAAPSPAPGWRAAVARVLRDMEGPTVPPVVAPRYGQRRDFVIGHLRASLPPGCIWWTDARLAHRGSLACRGEEERRTSWGHAPGTWGPATTTSAHPEPTASISVD